LSIYAEHIPESSALRALSYRGSALCLANRRFSGKPAR